MYYHTLMFLVLEEISLVHDMNADAIVTFVVYIAEQVVTTGMPNSSTCQLHFIGQTCYKFY